VTRETDNLLARIDEFNGLLTTVKAESQRVNDDAIPSLHAVNGASKPQTNTANK
jgi:hypothetical protein